MKLFRFMVGERCHIGVETARGAIDITAAGFDCKMNHLLAHWQEILPQLKIVLADLSLPLLDVSQLVFANVTKPEKILCVGLNYGKHAAETKGEPPKQPILFSKFNDALAAHKQQVALPQAAEKFDYEAELVIVIGQHLWQANQTQAAAGIFGYTCGNDLSARDAQFASGQWLIGKTFPGFAPAGPYIVPKEELDACNLSISCLVNGKEVQASNTADMIFKPTEIVRFASQYTPLAPGDLIFTGTPEGVILGKEKGQRIWLQKGDALEVSIQDIGTLQNVLG